MGPGEMARAWLEMCRTGDQAAFGELAAASFACHGPGGSGGREEFLAWLAWYPAVFGDQVVTVHEVLAAGDRAVARYSVASVYRGGFLGLPARGQRVREEGIIIFRIAGVRVAEMWFQGNDLQIAEQLGGRITTTAGSTHAGLAEE